jgi:hypothetical protein
LQLAIAKASSDRIKNWFFIKIVSYKTIYAGFSYSKENFKKQKQGQNVFLLSKNLLI